MPSSGSVTGQQPWQRHLAEGCQASAEGIAMGTSDERPGRSAVEVASVWDAIRARRNVRTYADRPVDPAHLDLILEAGRRSPSSQNWQRWDFVLVTDRERLGELATVWRGAGHVATSAATVALIAPAAD